MGVSGYGLRPVLKRVDPGFKPGGFIASEWFQHGNVDGFHQQEQGMDQRTGGEGEGVKTTSPFMGVLILEWIWHGMGEEDSEKQKKFTLQRVGMGAEWRRVRSR